MERQDGIQVHRLWSLDDQRCSLPKMIVTLSSICIPLHPCPFHLNLCLPLRGLHIISNQTWSMSPSPTSQRRMVFRDTPTPTVDVRASVCYTCSYQYRCKRIYKRHVVPSLSEKLFFTEKFISQKFSAMRRRGYSHKEPQLFRIVVCLRCVLEAVYVH